MVDNVSVSAGTGTTVATDDIAGVHYQKVKLALGPESFVGNLKETPFTTGGTAGNHTVLPAVSGKHIRVVGMVVSSSGLVDLLVQSNNATTIAGRFYLDTRSGIMLPFNPHGWFQTGLGLSLTINLSAAVAVGGILNYIEIS